MLDIVWEKTICPTPTHIFLNIQTHKMTIIQLVPHLCFMQFRFSITNNITVLARLFCRFWILYRAKQDGPVVLVNYLYLYSFFFFFPFQVLRFQVLNYIECSRAGATRGRAMVIILMGMNMNMNMRYLFLRYNSFLLKVLGLG